MYSVLCLKHYVKFDTLITMQWLFRPPFGIPVFLLLNSPTPSIRTRAYVPLCFHTRRSAISRILLLVLRLCKVEVGLHPCIFRC